MTTNKRRPRGRGPALTKLGGDQSNTRSVSDLADILTALRLRRDEAKARGDQRGVQRCREKMAVAYHRAPAVSW